MSRATNSPASRARRKRILKAAKGFYGSASKRIRNAMDAVDKANQHAYTGRKQKKRQYRQLWTARINAACRQEEINYSRFIDGLKKLNIELNRKVLADMAINDRTAFNALVAQAKAAIAK